MGINQTRPMIPFPDLRRTVIDDSQECRKNELGCTDARADGLDDDRTKDG